MNFREYLMHHKQVVDAEVEGWFYPIDIVILYGIFNEIQKDLTGDLCEIGVAYGKSAITVSNFKQPKDNLYLYDIFSEDIKNKAYENIKKFGKDKNIIWRIQDTTDLRFENLDFENNLKFLHVDGCHEHSVVLNDLTVFSAKMKEWGVICVDDFNDYEYPGVNSAVCQFIFSKHNYNNWKIFAIGHNKAFLCQQKYHKDYQVSLLNYMEKSKLEMNIPEEIEVAYGVREIYDTNVLLFNSRMKWTIDEAYGNLFKKPKVV
jgi:hypothetical protein